MDRFHFGIVVSFFFAFVFLPITTVRANTLSDSFHTTPNTPLDLNAGIIVGGLSALPGIDATVAFRLHTDFPLYVGGQLGFFMLTATNTSGVEIPILGTLYTPMEISRRASLRMGVSTGPVIAAGNGVSSAQFAALLDPALLFAIGDGLALNVQARFGVIGSTFVVLPQVGVSLPI